MKSPPRDKPAENPMVWPPPMHAKPMFLFFPGGNECVIRLTAVGRHIAMATPENARNAIIWGPVVARPQAMLKTAWKKHPTA